MADKKISDFATLTDLQSNDLLLVSSLNETYNTKVETLMDSIKGDGVVLFDQAQSLTNAQKTQARENINAASQEDLSAIEDVLSKVTESETITIDKSTGVKLDAYIATTGGIGSQENCKLIYFGCQPGTAYSISKVLSARFRVGYTTVVPAETVRVSGLIQNNDGTVINITPASNARYLVIYYYDGANDTLSESTIYNSLTITYVTDLTAVDEVARNGKVNVGQGSANAGKALIVNDDGNVGLGGAVRYDVAQSLTDEQKSQTQTNIGAASDSDMTAAKANITALQSNKVNIAQGSGNVGKALVVGNDGNVTTGDAGIPEAVKVALLDLVRHVAYIDERGQSYYNALYEALYNSGWYDKWVWEQSAGDIAVHNNTVGFLENIGNNIYIDQRADQENKRRSVQTTHGTVPFVLYNSVDGGIQTQVELYPIPVPPRAICVQMSCDTQNIQFGTLALRLENGIYREIRHSSLWKGLNKKDWFVTGENHYIAPFIRMKGGGDFTAALENMTLTFTRKGQWRWTLTDSDLVMYARSIAWDSANSRITYSASSVSNYKTIMANDGLCGYFVDGALVQQAPIPVPPTATKVTVTTTPALQAQMILLQAADDQTQQLIADNGWKATPAAMTFEAGDNLEVAVQLRVNASAQDFTTATTPTEIVIEFEEV